MRGPALVLVSNPYILTPKYAKYTFPTKSVIIRCCFFLVHYKFTTDIAKDIAELIHPLEAMKVVNVHTGLNSQKYANELWWTGYDLNRSQYTRRMRVDWVRHDVDVPIEVREGWVENTTFLATGKSLSPMGSHESQPLLIFLLELSDEIFLLSVSIYHFWAKIPFF